MVEVNCIGLKCPMPIIQTKRALSENPGKNLLIKVDNETSCKNLETYLADNGIEFSRREENGIFIIQTGNQVPLVLKEAEPYCSSTSDGYIVVINSNEMGKGNPELGVILLKGFLTALSESDNPPQEIICYNGGVLLASTGAGYASYLKKIAEKGVKITLCGTCVDFYNIKDTLEVGEISNMFYILERLNSQHKIVTP